MYYKNKDIEYDNYQNIILGFPKYYKVLKNRFTLIDTYDMISVEYYDKEINFEKLVKIDKEEWDIVEGIISKAYKMHRNQFFCD
jgi:hypothetical protein